MYKIVILKPDTDTSLCIVSFSRHHTFERISEVGTVTEMSFDYKRLQGNIYICLNRLIWEECISLV